MRRVDNLENLEKPLLIFYRSSSVANIGPTIGEP